MSGVSAIYYRRTRRAPDLTSERIATLLGVSRTPIQLKELGDPPTRDANSWGGGLDPPNAKRQQLGGWVWTPPQSLSPTAGGGGGSGELRCAPPPQSNVHGLLED